MPRGKPNDGSKNPGGAPKTYDANKIADDLADYIDSTDDPYIEEFSLLQPFNRDTLYTLAKESEKLSDNIKRCHEKQKMRTVRKAEVGEINPTFAIFKLKQKCYGWTDKQEIESVNVNVDMTLEEAEQILKEKGIVL